MERLKQLKAAFDMTRKADPKLPLFIAGGFLLGFAAFFVLGFLLHPIAGVIFGLLGGSTAGVIVFGRRAMKTQYAMLEGQPGAAIAVLQSQRGFLVSPAIAFNKNQDMVHLAVSRAGVLLIGEGRPGGVRNLLKQQHKRMERAVGDVPIHELSVGTGEGQIAIGDVRSAATKLKPVMKKPEMYDLHTKLEAIAKKFQPKMPGGAVHQKRPKIR